MQPNGKLRNEVLNDTDDLLLTRYNDKTDAERDVCTRVKYIPLSLNL